MSVEQIHSYTFGGAVGGAVGAGVGWLADGVGQVVTATPTNWPAVACVVAGAISGVAMQILKNRNDSRRAESAELRLSLANKRLKDHGVDPVGD